jgi:V/A-type H+-transporting ATPase subunit D
MSKISSTRMALLACKAQIELAKRGRELLEQKRAALMKQLMSMADIAMQSSDILQKAAAEAHYALAWAEVVAGAEAVKSASLAARAEFPLQVESVSVMGVRVPVIERKRVSRSMLGRNYAVTGTSITIDEAASAFEAEVEAIVQLAEIELRLTRLASEVQRTSRRLNALEHSLIPRLEAERDHIQLALDERERSEYVRLKAVGRALERKRVASDDKGLRQKTKHG